MLYAITGTPGTGKTTVARLLGEELDIPVVNLNETLKQDERFTSRDTARDALSVDTEEMVEAYMEELPDDAIIDGHLSHFFPADMVFVLRCSPSTLRERLKEREWSRGKVEENLEAEALDMILQEAVERCEDVREIDTTDRSPDEVAAVIKRLLADTGDEGYRPGQVSWAEDYFAR